MLQLMNYLIRMVTSVAEVVSRLFPGLFPGKSGSRFLIDGYCLYKVHSYFVNIQVIMLLVYSNGLSLEKFYEYKSISNNKQQYYSLNESYHSRTILVVKEILFVLRKTTQKTNAIDRIIA